MDPAYLIQCIGQYLPDQAARRQSRARTRSRQPVLRLHARLKTGMQIDSERLKALSGASWRRTKHPSGFLPAGQVID
jgi:hypothetical protein